MSGSDVCEAAEAHGFCRTSGTGPLQAHFCWFTARTSCFRTDGETVETSQNQTSGTTDACRRTNLQNHQVLLKVLSSPERSHGVYGVYASYQSLQVTTPLLCCDGGGCGGGASCPPAVTLRSGTESSSAVILTPSINLGPSSAEHLLVCSIETNPSKNQMEMTLRSTQTEPRQTEPLLTQQVLPRSQNPDTSRRSREVLVG